MGSEMCIRDRLHDCIVPEVFEQEDTLKVSLCDGAGQPYAVVEFRKQKQ